ncbi:PH domain-containing protein [Cohnella herbarum]|uniref:PH domain-containing protein n=1 Tax=Cohnella herbarum TaxID=2728023 RepID=A0A7Z2ZPT4_9BACL|nr:PH domain-containing protein [Cohnella herbarum]QJD87245.1 PH domain-containing protein [Cohnella herbarum]
MVKVQHVELTSGPLMRKKELADVVIVTAATKHSIHGLEKDHAEAVQRRIAVWARVREDDV